MIKGSKIGEILEGHIRVSAVVQTSRLYHKQNT